MKMKLKSILIVSLTFFSLWTVLPCRVASAASIKWYSHEEGMAIGKKEEKKIFLHFYADWCTYCKKMEKETFSNQSVASYLNENFIPIKVNSDKERKIANRYNVRGLPTTWFISKHGDIIGNQPGFMPPDKLLPLLKYIQTNSYKKMSFKNFLKSL